MLFTSTAVGYDLDKARAQFIIEHGVPELFSVGGRDGVPLWYVVTIAEQPHNVQYSMLAAGVKVPEPVKESAPEPISVDAVVAQVLRMNREERARVRAELDAADAIELAVESKPSGVLFPDVAAEIEFTEKRMEPTEEEFESFYAEFPRRVNKAKAKIAFAKAFGRLRKSMDCETAIRTIMDGVQVYSENADPDALCHPTTWLNGDRWEDDPSGIGKQDRRSRNLDNARLGTFVEREPTPISEAVF